MWWVWDGEAGLEELRTALLLQLLAPLQPALERLLRHPFPWTVGSLLGPQV